MAEDDLAAWVVPFLDPHLVFPLLVFLSVGEIDNETKLSQWDLPSDTDVVGFARDVHKDLYSDDIPRALREKRTMAVVPPKQFQAETEPIGKKLDPESARQMWSTKDGRMLFDYLVDKHDFRQEYLDTLHRKAKVQHECGNHPGAAECLYFLRVLVPAT